MSGFTKPQMSFTSAFIHSTLSGVGGLLTSALFFNKFMRTLSTSFSTFRPAFSTPTQTTAAIDQMSALRVNHAIHPICLPHAVKIQVTKHRVVVMMAPVRKMFFVWLRSASSTSGGKGWMQILPTSEMTGAGSRGSCFEGEGGRRTAVPAFGCAGSKASLSRPFSRNSGRILLIMWKHYMLCVTHLRSWDL